MSATALGLTLVVFCALLEGLAQIAWKAASGSLERGWPWIVVGSGAYGLEILLYTAALTLIDVTIAFAMGSLSFVFVAIFSQLFLKEYISPLRGAGLLLILIGVAYLGAQA